MSKRLLITFVSAIFIALCWGVAFMFFFGDVISYHMGAFDKGIGFYAVGGGTTVALTFMLAIDIVLCVIYFRKGKVYDSKKDNFIKGSE
tara:strand:+ start:384 stop:650 length:267 start_codon:yes stop_codon:yes gene_type:complete